MYAISKEEFIDAVKKSSSVRQVLKLLGLKPAGGNYQTFHNKVKEYNLDTSHFTGQGHNKDKKFGPKRPIEDYLSNKHTTKSHSLRLRLITEGLKQHKCEKCKLEEWLNTPIPLELHHKDGNHSNNNLDNLQLLCPNCHTYTDNYRGKAKKKAGL